MSSFLRHSCLLDLPKRIPELTFPFCKHPSVPNICLAITTANGSETDINSVLLLLLQTKGNLFLKSCKWGTKLEVQCLNTIII
jgi:hypothetical protein